MLFTKRRRDVLIDFLAQLSVTSDCSGWSGTSLFLETYPIRYMQYASRFFRKRYEFRDKTPKMKPAHGILDQESILFDAMHGERPETISVMLDVTSRMASCAMAKTFTPDEVAHAFDVFETILKERYPDDIVHDAVKLYKEPVIGMARSFCAEDSNKKKGE